MEIKIEYADYWESDDFKEWLELSKIKQYDYSNVPPPKTYDFLFTKRENKL